MSMPKKDSEYLSCRLAKEQYDKMVHISKDSGLTKTKVVEKALDMFYDHYKKTGKV